MASESAERDPETARDDLAIWWLNQRECETVCGETETAPESLPEYVRREVQSRYGRNGRGRLWIPKEIDDGTVAVDPWPDNAMARQIGDTHGGIVLYRVDQPRIASMPGILTDMRLNRI